MKIHSPQQSASSKMLNGHQAFRLLAFCGAVTLGVTACMSVQAQSGLFDGLAASGASQAESQGGVRNGLFTLGNEDYRVVNTASYRTAADIGETEVGTVAPVSYGSCGSCGTSCGGSCGNSYGGYGRIPGPCAPCEPYCYVSVEALYMDRRMEGRYAVSPNFYMNDFDYEVAPRLTIGRVPDCVHGYEFSFTGQFQWDRGAAISDPSGGIGTSLNPAFPVIEDNLSAFRNATNQVQRHTSKYWSVDANNTLVGWEVAKLLYGIRYIDYQQEFSYTSRNIDGEVGSLQSDVKNRLVGGQIGMDLLYPICTNGYTDFRARGGLFINFADLDLVAINDGSTVAALFDNKERLAAAFEVAGGLRYQLGQMLSIRAGAELWYLTRIATSHEQHRTVILGNRGVRVKDDVLMVGISLGAELKY